MAKPDNGSAARRQPAVIDITRVGDATHDLAAGLAPVTRVKKAYEQVADQLRTLIVSSKLRPGDRLPNETVLAKEFGVSRATVREALRILAAQRLIFTAKGAGGGTYVSMPGFDFISDFLEANINLLTEMRRITLQELLEAREQLEVFAARKAAERRSGDDLERLDASVPSIHEPLGRDERFGFNINFHSILMELGGNTLLQVSALPVFSVLQTNLGRQELPSEWHVDVSRQHGDIAEAIRDQDGDAAARLMTEHLAFLRPSYERVWRHAI